VDAIAIGKRLRDLDRPPTHLRLQSIVVVGLAFLISVPFVLRIPHAGNPAAVLGLALQTLAGLLASAQLWANRAADVAVQWIARQIGRGRRSVLGLLDGRPLSMCLAGGLYVIATLMANALWGVSPSGVGAIFVGLPALMIVAAATCVFVLAMCMLVGWVLAPKAPLPDGAAVTGACSRLSADGWIWPTVGFAFLLGGLLQALGG
jgi:hypothetical protein